MREFLEDAIEHREDGYGRAQKHAQRELPRRFYETADVEARADGYAVTLDGRPTKTRGQVPVVVPVEQLGRDMAAEWGAQGTHIDPDTMPVVKLINSALEGGEATADALRKEVIKFAGNDLLLYRAESPRELVAEQERRWDDALVRVARHFNVAFQPTVGIIHQAQPGETLTRLDEAVADADILTLTALVSITGITSSGLLAISLRHGLIGADEAWAAAHVDEDHNIRLWGEDPEAAARRAQRRKEYDAALRVIELVDTRG